MKNIKYIIYSVIVYFYLIASVSASNYVDAEYFNLSKDFDDEIKIEVNGYNPIMSPAFEDSEGNIILIGHYKENNSLFANNNYVIPDSDGGGINGNSGGTSVRAHAKIVKLDKKLNKLWEKDFYQKGNWGGAVESADTVETNINDVVELSDGSYLAVGYTHGLVRKNTAEKDDDFDSIYGRFDNNGNELYRYLYYDEGLDQAVAVRALIDGGYIIKFYCQFKGMVTNKTPNEFKVDEIDAQYYYVVYNDKNEITDVFSENKAYYLDNYEFKNNNAKYDLKYSTLNLYTYIDGKKYLGTTINNNSIFIEKTKNSSNDYNNLSIYDAESSNLIKTVDVSKYKYKNNIRFINLNDGGFVIGSTTFNSEGEVISSFEDYKEADTLVLSDGRILTLNPKENNALLINNSNQNQDFANFVINGQKINYNLGTFIENDRTYIKLNNLCSVMQCNYKRSEKDSNKLIIDFDIFNTNNNHMIKYSDSTNTEINQRVKYTVVHEIGSKSYSTYLSFQPLKIFRLASPYYDENAVDVASKEIDGQIYVPLRFISEALGRYVKYEPNGENGKPTITIGAYGEGDFYEKYGIAISYEKLNENDILKNVIQENSLELTWGMQKLVYGYGYIKAENKVVSVDKTVFVPTQDRIVRSGMNIEYNGYDDTILKDSYKWLSFESSNNWIGKQEMYKDNNGEQGDKFYGSGEYESFMLVSNIEGYPFLKIVNFK